MNKADIEFKIGLNTSPAEQQLYSLGEKMKSTAHIYNDVFKDVGQGFKTVGTPYQNSNNHNVPSTQVLERSLAMVENSMEKFARIVEQISIRMVNFQTVGSSYTNAPNTIYASNRVAGYLPTTPWDKTTAYPWYPTTHFDHYTSAQANDINRGIAGGYNPSDVFNSLIYKRKNNPYTGVYDMFSQINSPIGAMGMYAIWSKLFGKKSPIAIEGTVGGPAGADGNDTPSEQINDVVEGDKKDNDELKEKLLLWSKIGATIYAIRKVISGLAKLWKFEADISTGANRNINEEHGFFTIDPEGALRANSDKTRAMLYAGIRNMGENAPVSKEGLDYASSKMTEMWTAAMSGRNVDARTTIDAQRLKDFFGIDLTVAGLLTGEREGKTATDIQIDMMEKVEKQISKLAEADEVTKGQVIDSLKNILGDELVNAIVANANKNLKIDASELKLTLAERLMEHGGSAIPAGNLTEATTNAVTSLSELKDSLQQLKNTVSTELSPAFTKVTKAIIGLVNWLNRKINRVDGTKNATGEILFKTSVASLTNDYNAYGQFSQKEDDTVDKFKDKDKRVARDLKSKNAYDIFEAMWLSQPEAVSAADIENLGIKATQDVIGRKLVKGELDEKSANPIERAMAKHTWVDAKGRVYKGIEAYKMQMANEDNLKWNNDLVYQLFNNAQNMSPYDQIRAYEYFIKNNPEVQGYFASAFDKGGALDYNTNMNVGRYLMQQAFYESPEQFAEFLNEMKQKMKEVADNTVEFSTQWTDKNHNGKKDFGEMTVTIVVKDQYGNKIREEPLTAQLN